MLSQPTGIGGGVGTGGGIVEVGTGERVVASSATGDGSVDVGPAIGCIVISGCFGGLSVTGSNVVILSVVVALHPICGLPVVPGGHRQTGRWLIDVQSASSPHVLRLHTS